MISFPAGATHACFASAWAVFDFAKKKSELQVSEEQVITRTAKSVKLSLKPGKPKLKGLSVFVFRISFAQDIGGIQYIFSNKKFNVCKVVGVGAS